MNSKILLATIAILVLLGTGLYVTRHNSGPQTKEEAIKQAQAYRPEGGCTQALVPAVHKATGAKYTFYNGCLAPGWEAEQ